MANTARGSTVAMEYGFGGGNLSRESAARRLQSFALPLFLFSSCFKDLHFRVGFLTDGEVGKNTEIFVDLGLWRKELGGGNFMF